MNAGRDRPLQQHRALVALDNVRAAQQLATRPVVRCDDGTCQSRSLKMTNRADHTRASSKGLSVAPIQPGPSRLLVRFVCQSQSLTSPLH